MGNQSSSVSFTHQTIAFFFSVNKEEVLFDYLPVLSYHFHHNHHNPLKGFTILYQLIIQSPYLFFIEPSHHMH